MKKDGVVVRGAALQVEFGMRALRWWTWWKPMCGREALFEAVRQPDMSLPTGRGGVVVGPGTRLDSPVRTSSKLVRCK